MSTTAYLVTHSAAHERWRKRERRRDLLYNPRMVNSKAKRTVNWQEAREINKDWPSK